MKRRAILLGSAAALGVLASAGLAAQRRPHRMAVLNAQTPEAVAHYFAVLFKRLRELGYEEGRNLIVERRYAEGRLERLPALAAELVALKPDLLFAAPSQSALAASKATSTIPIVFVAVSDPVGLGIVKNLARPGTNATGLSAQNIDVHGKRLQLLREVFPSASRVTVLHNPLNMVEHEMLAVLRRSSGPLKIDLRVQPIRAEEDFASVFAAIDREPPQVLYVLESPFTFLHRARIVEFANARRLHAVYGLHEYVHSGGLMSYSFSLLEHYSRGADYVVRILKGADPAELPVEQPTRFELVINMKTARAQGVSFPAAILARADQVIE